jgi:hypothetical protein
VEPPRCKLFQRPERERERERGQWLEYVGLKATPYRSVGRRPANGARHFDMAQRAARSPPAPAAATLRTRAALSQHRAYKMTQLPAYCLSTLAPPPWASDGGDTASPRQGHWCPEPKRSSIRRRFSPRFSSPYLSSRVSVHSSVKLARCRIRQLLLRISTDSPSISPTIPPCYSLRRQRSARGCSATRHWDLGPLQA